MRALIFSAIWIASIVWATTAFLIIKLTSRAVQCHFLDSFSYASHNCCLIVTLFFLWTAPSEQEKQDSGASKETDSSNKASPASSQDPSYILQKPGEDDANFIPALVIVVVLATPIALICAAATIQHLRFKHRKNMVLRKKNGETLSPKQSSACFGCCRTKKFYYDDKRGFDKLIGNEDSDESEDDYFVRKGAI